MSWDLTILFPMYFTGLHVRLCGAGKKEKQVSEDTVRRQVQAALGCESPPASGGAGTVGPRR